jgi:peptidoglycan/LPS O-acetylase OafA/YrhL
MRLTFKDAIGAMLAALVVLVFLDFTYAWGWPLLGDYRAGVVALAVIGFAMCATASDYSEVRWPDPLIAIAAVLGIAAAALIVAGLIWATQALFEWLAVVIVALWLVATIRHMFVGRHEFPATPVMS